MPPVDGAPTRRPDPSRDPAATHRRSDPAGVYHRLDRGQTLYTLSRLYRVPLDRLLAVNRITDPTSIPAGEPILIPGATRLLPYPTPEGGRLTWPLHGQVTSRYGRPRGRRSHHVGLDIDGEDGDVIRAAAAGRVEQAKRGSRYGRYLVIDHGGGLQTLYAHASRLLVTRGDRVEAGDPVALVGRSGNAHGSHLHFEVHRDGRTVDPLPLLRGDSARATTGH